MSEKRRLIKGTLLGGALTAFVLAGVFGLGFLLGPLALNGAQASTALQTATNGHLATTGTTASNHKDQQYYSDLLEQNLATRLGVDKAKVNSAFAGAVNDTVSQAVQNGDLSQDQATQLKDAANKGVGSFVATIAGGSIQGQPDKVADPRTDELVNAALAAAATQLGMASEDDLLSAMKQGGQSLTALAQAKNITTQALQDTMLHAAKADADRNVASGKWTQVQADEAYQNVTNMASKMLSAAQVEGDGRSMNDLAPAAFHAAGQFIHLSNPDDFGLLVKRDNKTLAQIAQEHNVSLDALKNALLQAARTQANSQVSSGTWTQAQADDAYNGFNDLVQKLSITPLTGPQATPTP